jgi:hypothetical protein
MTDMQIAVGLGREAGLYRNVFSRSKIIFNDVADKISDNGFFNNTHGLNLLLGAGGVLYMLRQGLGQAGRRVCRNSRGKFYHWHNRLAVPALARVTQIIINDGGVQLAAL